MNRRHLNREIVNRVIIRARENARELRSIIDERAAACKQKLSVVVLGVMATSLLMSPRLFFPGSIIGRVCFDDRRL